MHGLLKSAIALVAVTPCSFDAGGALRSSISKVSDGSERVAQPGRKSGVHYDDAISCLEAVNDSTAAYTDEDYDPLAFYECPPYFPMNDSTFGTILGFGPITVVAKETYDYSLGVPFPIGPSTSVAYPEFTLIRSVGGTSGDYPEGHYKPSSATNGVSNNMVLLPSSYVAVVCRTYRDPSSYKWKGTIMPAPAQNHNLRWMRIRH